MLLSKFKYGFLDDGAGSGGGAGNGSGAGSNGGSGGRSGGITLTNEEYTRLVANSAKAENLERALESEKAAVLKKGEELSEAQKLIEANKGELEKVAKTVTESIDAELATIKDEETKAKVLALLGNERTVDSLKKLKDILSLMPKEAGQQGTGNPPPPDPKGGNGGAGGSGGSGKPGERKDRSQMTPAEIIADVRGMKLRDAINDMKKS